MQAKKQLKEDTKQTSWKRRDEKLDLIGFDNPKVVSYQQVLKGEVEIGQRVALIGAGGIGFDMAHFLGEKQSATLQPDKWLKQWGIDKDYQQRGGLSEPEVEPTARQIYLLQRKVSKMGKGLSVF